MLVVDTNSNVSGHISVLKEKGVGVVGRYFSSATWKRISKTEASEIAAAGMKIFTIFENDGDPDLKSDAGTSHAQQALQQAKTIGQPEGSTIYFALEHLPNGYADYDVPDIAEYISQIRDVLGDKYRIGVYSDGVVLEALLDKKLIDCAWLSASRGFPGSKEFYTSKRWVLAQNPHVDLDWNGLSIDLNECKDDFGQFTLSSISEPRVDLMASGRAASEAVRDIEFGRAWAAPGTDRSIGLGDRVPWPPISAPAPQRRITSAHVLELSRRRGVSTAMLHAMPDSIARRTLGRLQYADLPRAREAFRRSQARNDEGNVPPHAAQSALRQYQQSATAASARFEARASARPTSATIAGVPIGPRTAFVAETAGLHPTHTGWTSLGPGNIGGRIRSIVVDPRQSSQIWAGSVGGGVWRTRDGGQNWEAVDDFLADLAVSCMAIDRSHPDTIYAGTGEGFFNVDAIRGAGIFWTRDATNWTQIPQTNTSNFQAVNRIAVSADGAVVLAATGSGIFRSDDAGRTTWSQTLSEEVAFVACHPQDSAQAVAGGLRNGKAYFSTNGGQTWSPAQGGIWAGRVELAYAAHDPSTVYASVDVNGGEIWRSLDGGRSFARRGSVGTDQKPTNYLGDQGWYGNSIWAGDPKDANLVLVGGIDLWRSTDGGDSLIDISTWWDDRSCHADHHSIVADPQYNGATNSTVYFGNDGGVYKTEDARTVGNDPQPPRIAGWIKLDNSFGITQFYSGAGNPATGMILGGAQDNGTLTYTPQSGSQKWGTMFGGDGGFCAVDPADPNISYGEYVYLNIHRSLDRGLSADYISGQFWDGQQWKFKPAPYQIPDAASQQALFIAPFVLDPNNPNRILAGGHSLWRTDDAKTSNTNDSGPSWASIKHSFISAIAIAPGNSDIVWVGHEDGQIYKTTNGTDLAPTWQQLDNRGGNPLNPSRYCTRITIDPTASDTVYVMFGGYVPANLWKTTDGGANWTSVGAASLPSSPIRGLALHPDNPNFLYLGTEVGLFASEDAGANWSPTNEGPTNCSVDDLFWMKKTLVAVTHGRGMFSIDLTTATLMVDRVGPAGYSGPPPTLTSAQPRTNSSSSTVLGFDNPSAPSAAAVGASPPSTGWVISIERIRSEERAGEGFARTIGTYAILHGGVPQPGLSGMTVERQGPGDNGAVGKAQHRCIAAGAYPLRAHASDKYKTTSYATNGFHPRPAIELGNTGDRTAILVHPADGYGSTIGCINLAGSLADADSDISLPDSMSRVIAVIEDLRTFSGGRLKLSEDGSIQNAQLIITDGAAQVPALAQELEAAIQVSELAPSVQDCLIYEQVTGRMLTKEAGQYDTLGVGYSGSLSKGGKNDPSKQCEKDIGPIPRGLYIVGLPRPGPSPYSLPLTPDPSNDMCGRGDFLIHGDSISHPGNASEGCIILPRSDREAIVKTGLKLLFVTDHISN